MIALLLVGFALCNVIPGGFQPCPIDFVPKSNSVAIVNSVEYFRRQDGLDYDFISVTKCEMQIVAGTNYRLTLKLRTKGLFALKEASFFQSLGGEVTLTMKPIIERKEEDKKEKEEAIPLFGGWSPCDMKANAEVGMAQNFAIADLNARSNSIHRIVLVKVLNCQEQIVAGMNYKFNLLCSFENNLNNTFEKEITIFRGIDGSFSSHF